MHNILCWCIYIDWYWIYFDVLKRWSRTKIPAWEKLQYASVISSKQGWSSPSWYAWHDILDCFGGSLIFLGFRFILYQSIDEEMVWNGLMVQPMHVRRSWKKELFNRKGDLRLQPQMDHQRYLDWYSPRILTVGSLTLNWFWECEWLDVFCEIPLSIKTWIFSGKHKWLWFSILQSSQMHCILF